MNRTFHSIALVLAAALLAALGCTRLEPSGRDGEPVKAEVVIHAEFPGVRVETKTDPAVAYEGNYGILVCVHGDAGYGQFKPATYNVRAGWNETGFSGKWSFRDVVSYTSGALFTEASEKFFLMGRNDSKTADFYAYAPWVQSAYHHKPTDVPFDRSMNLMYAAENNTDSNKSKDPADVNPLTATFTFQHAMARLVFRFKLNNTDDAGTPNTTYYVSLASLKRSPSATGSHLYSGGRFNAIDGTFPTLTEVSEVSGGGCYVTRTDYQDSFGILLVPTEVAADDELTFTFMSGGHTLPPFVLKREMVKHSDGATYGFKAGYIYTFDFTLDNYVRFDKFDIAAWTDEELARHGTI